MRLILVLAEQLSADAPLPAGARLHLPDHRLARLCAWHLGLEGTRIFNAERPEPQRRPAARRLGGEQDQR